jgi:hypothetical protein
VLVAKLCDCSVVEGARTEASDDLFAPISISAPVGHLAPESPMSPGAPAAVDFVNRTICANTTLAWRPPFWCLLHLEMRFVARHRSLRPSEHDCCIGPDQREAQSGIPVLSLAPTAIVRQLNVFVAVLSLDVLPPVFLGPSGWSPLRPRRSVSRLSGIRDVLQPHRHIRPGERLGESSIFDRDRQSGHKTGCRGDLIFEWAASLPLPM